MHVSAFVVPRNIFIKAGGDRGIVYDYWILAEVGIDSYLKDIQQFTGITTAHGEEGFSLLHFNVQSLEQHIVVYCPVKKAGKFFHAQGFQDKDLAAGEQRIDHLEGRVFSCSTYQDHGPVLHSSEQGILLGLVETVNLIDEKYGCSLACREYGFPFGLGQFDDFPHILHSAADCGEGMELTVQGICDYPGQCGLSDAWRPPKDEGTKLSGVHKLAQDPTFTHEMRLSDVFFEGIGPHSLRKWW